MTRARRDFTPAFKREAVTLLQSSGRPLTRIAAEFGIQPSMLRNAPRSRAAGAGSVLAAAASPFSPSSADLTGPALSPTEAAEAARLRRELERTRRKRDILERAVGIFSETPR